MLKFCVLLVLFCLLIWTSILGMTHGWGLTLQSLPWVIGSHAAAFIIGGIMGAVSE